MKEGGKRDEVKRGWRGVAFTLWFIPLSWKKRSATVFLLGKNKENKGIYFQGDSSSHIWLPNLKSVIFFFSAVEPVPTSSQLQHFTATSLWTKVFSSSLRLGGGLALQRCHSPGLITGFCTATHAWLPGTVLDSISCQQNKFSNNSSRHAKRSPRRRPSAQLCNFQASFQASRNKRKRSASETGGVWSSNRIQRLHFSAFSITLDTFHFKICPQSRQPIKQFCDPKWVLTH